MFQRGLLCLLLAGVASAQSPMSNSPSPQAGAQAATPAPPAAAPVVAPDAAVITIPGLCDNPPADKTAAADCKTVVTRAQFEEILSTVAPKMPGAMKKQFANRIASGMIMSSEAHKAGVDQGPKYDEMMKLARLQVLQQLMTQHVQEKAGEISDKDLEDYYNANKPAFEEADLQKIFIPRMKQVDPPKTKLSDEAQKKQDELSEAAMKKEADLIHTRAVAGGDFAKLQEEAFLAAGMKGKAPNTAMGKTRRRQLPPTQDSVLELKEGEVSAVIEDANGYVIYKVVSKDTIALDKASEEIRNTMRSQRMQEMMQAIQKSATPVLDEAYFGPPAGAPGAGSGMPPGMGGMQMGAPAKAPAKPPTLSK